MPSGVVMPYWSDRPPGETLEIALNAERFGYREIWMGEMLHFDGFALAGALAAQTSNATITVGPLPVGLRDPVGLAMGIASIGVLGGRPARLALGASSPAVVDGWHGHAWDGNPARMEEAVALIRSVLRGERTDHHGVYFRSRGFRSGLGPQPGHITLAALGPRALAAADRCADRIVMNLVPSEQVAKVTPSITRPLAVWLVAGVDPSAEGWRQVRRQIALYLAAPGYSQVLTAAGLGEVVEVARAGMPMRDLAERVTPAHVEAVAALGGRDHVAAIVDRYESVGVEVMLVPVTAGDPGGHRTLAALRTD